MATQTYTKYSSSRFGSRRLSGVKRDAPARRHSSRAGGGRADSNRAASRGGKGRTGIVRKITTLVMIAGLAVVLYAAGTVGYGYYQAKAGQSELRSLFNITGSGSVDPVYFRPTEVNDLCGDARKAHAKLGWRHRTSFDALVREMMEMDFRELGLKLS